MPIFLTTTVTSRHDARLSSTTHCALRASRINYNLTNLSRCYSFLFFYYGPMQHPAVQPISFSYSLKCFLVILQALSLCQNHQTSYTTKLQIPHAAQLSRFHLFFHAYHYCQEPYRLHLANLSHSNGSQVFQPCNDLWYLPKICSRISQICLCISVSNSLR